MSTRKTLASPSTLPSFIDVMRSCGRGSEATFASDFAQARARDTELAGPIAPLPALAPDPQADLRRMYVAAIRAQEAEHKRLRALGVQEYDLGRAMAGNPHRVDFRQFAGLRCGARGKRTGRPCPHTGLYGNGRCHWHGGPSTGPKTPEGKARSARIQASLDV